MRRSLSRRATEKKEPFARSSYYFFLVVITHKTKATACRALTFIVRVFVNDSIAVAVWTSFSFHVVCLEAYLDEAARY